MVLQFRKMQEIYRQIGFKVVSVSSGRLLDFPATWLAANTHEQPGPDEEQDLLNPTEMGSLVNRLELSSAASRNIRIGFVNATITDPDGFLASGWVKDVGDDPAVVSLGATDREKYNILAHEVGHVLGRVHQETFPNNKDHWLMRNSPQSKWSNDWMAAKRWHWTDSTEMLDATYVTLP